MLHIHNSLLFKIHHRKKMVSSPTQLILSGVPGLVLKMSLKASIGKPLGCSPKQYQFPGI